MMPSQHNGTIMYHNELIFSGYLPFLPGFDVDAQTLESLWQLRRGMIEAGETGALLELN